MYFLSILRDAAAQMRELFLKVGHTPPVMLPGDTSSHSSSSVFSSARRFSSCDARRMVSSALTKFARLSSSLAISASRAAILRLEFFRAILPLFQLHGIHALGGLLRIGDWGLGIGGWMTVRGQRQVDLFAFLAPNVVFVVARENVHFAVAHFEDARGKFIDEVAVVRNEDHRSGVFLQRFQQHVLGAHVQVIGGLVEQQEIRRLQQHAGQRVAVALAAREHADALEHVVFGKQETAQQAAQLGVGGARSFALQIVQHARVGVEFLVLILREVIDAQRCGPGDIRRS